MDILRRHDLPFSCVNRVELDRQHLSDVDLVIAVGGDGTVLSAAHFLDHGTSEYVLPLLVLYSAYYHCDFDTVMKQIPQHDMRKHIKVPILGINSDPSSEEEK